MSDTLKTLLLDAAQFVAGAVANGYGEPSQAKRIALALATEAGQGEQMAHALARAEATPHHCLCKMLGEVASLVGEFAETGRLRDRAGDENAALAFYSCGERLAEILRPLAPKPKPEEPR